MCGFFTACESMRGTEVPAHTHTHTLDECESKCGLMVRNWLFLIRETVRLASSFKAAARRVCYLR